MNEEELERQSDLLAELLNDPRTAVDDLVRIIERDPVLADRVLALVNSARFGTRRRVTVLREAVVLLGFRILRRLVEERRRRLREGKVGPREREAGF